MQPRADDLHLCDCDEQANLCEGCRGECQGKAMLKPYYEQDGITIYHGDCREILPHLEKVDLVLTDPPYSVSKPGSGRWEMRYGRTQDLDFFPGDNDWEAMKETVSTAIQMAAEKLAPHGSLYAWCGHRQFGRLVDQLEADGWSTRFLVWSKSCPVPPAPGSGWPSAAELCLYAYRAGRRWNYKGVCPVRSNVIVADGYRYGNPGKVEHPTQKPFGVTTPLLLASAQSGDTILDPFMGSGTTLRAAKDLGLKAIGIEIEEKYCEIAAKRLSQQVFDFETA